MRWRSGVVDDEPVGGTLALVVLLGLGERAQLRVPVGLQRVGHQPVGRVDLHVALAGVVGLVLRSLDLPVAQAIGLVEAGCDLLLDGERHLERHRRDGLDQQRADGRIDLRCPGCSGTTGRRRAGRARRTRSWG